MRGEILALRVDSKTVPLRVNDGHGSNCGLSSPHAEYLGSPNRRASSADPTQWHAGVPAYGAVRHRGLYDGIDMRVREEAGRLEYDLMLEPGADLVRVVVRARGTSAMWRVRGNSTSGAPGAWSLVRRVRPTTGPVATTTTTTTPPPTTTTRPPTTTTPVTTTTVPPTADTVAIQRAEYDGGNRRLRVEAASSNSSATLTVHVTSTNAVIGTLSNDGGGRYGGDLSWSVNPQSITVRSNRGGTATRTVTAK